jgi:hypothetical protein
MAIQEIPLTADNQQFSIILAGTTWRISITWRDLYWIMDLQNDRGEPVISGIPLVTGADLLAQYAYMGSALSWWWSVTTAHRIIRRKPTWAAAVIYWYQRSKHVTELDETFRAAARGRERAGY